MSFGIHVLNKGKKKRGAKKRTAKKTSRRRTTKRRASKKPSRRRASTAKRSAAPTKKRRRRKAVAVQAPTMAKRRRRRSTTSHKRRSRRRRRNPGLPGLGGIGKIVKDTIPMGIGALAAAAIAKQAGRWGQPIGEQSELAGAPWTWAQYAGASVASFLLAKYGTKAGLSHDTAQKLAIGSAALGAIKGVFTILAPKVGFVQQFLGAGDEIEYDPNTGQAWYYENGKKVALQGYGMGGLVTASPMDGYRYANYGMAGIVTASPMDGEDDNLGSDDTGVLDAYG